MDENSVIFHFRVKKLSGSSKDPRDVKRVPNTNLSYNTFPADKFPSMLTSNKVPSYRKKNLNNKTLKMKHF